MLSNRDSCFVDSEEMQVLVDANDCRVLFEVVRYGFVTKLEVLLESVDNH